MDKLISIAMCTYNGERFIKEQLDSILNQSYTNIELIITDDGSSDNTLKIIEEYKQKDTRVFLHQNEKNLGFVKNFEKALSLCKGEYIALADQDDIWKPQKLESFIKDIGDNILIYSDAILVDEHSLGIGGELIRPERCLVKGKCAESLLLTNVISGNTMMFKKELIPHILPIPDTMDYHDIWIGFVAANQGSLTYTDEAMIYYRRYQEQVTNVEKQVHKSFFDRLNNKKEQWLKVAKEHLAHLETYKSANIIQDEETLLIVNELIQHYKTFENIYFNLSLYKIFQENKQDIFAAFRKSKRSKKAFRTSVGLKLRMLTLFKL